MNISLSIPRGFLCFALFFMLFSVFPVYAADDDPDMDEVYGSKDNCPYDYNPDQYDMDEDGLGDACDQCDDRDFDGDGVINCYDECIEEYGTKANGGCPEAAPSDYDKDGVPDEWDNCFDMYNDDQSDVDDDGVGDACDGCDDRDSDKDGIVNCLDYCISEKETVNGYQDDDGCPDEIILIDTDGDGIYDYEDNCPTVSNSKQSDLDGDEVGDECDKCDDRDPDNDKIPNCIDQCPNEKENKNGINDDDGCPDTTTTTTTTVTLYPLMNFSLLLDPSGGPRNFIYVFLNDPAPSPQIFIFVNNQSIRGCRNVVQCIAQVPELTRTTPIGVLALGQNGQNRSNGSIPTVVTIQPNLLQDTDGDGINNMNDNCRDASNANQADYDHDGVGDACDACSINTLCSSTPLVEVLASCGSSTAIPFLQNGEYYHERLYQTMMSTGCGCSDTDGMNYFSRGSVYTESVNSYPRARDPFTGRAGCGATSSCNLISTDRCVDSGTLMEYICTPSGVSQVTTRCSGGCSNGACVCEDSDGGWNYFVRGAIDINEDYCENFTLHEYSCGTSLYVESRDIVCRYGCTQGACDCTESDGGIDYAVQGTIGNVSEYCLPDNRTLVENSVTRTNTVCSFSNHTYRCEGACRNGACQPVSCSDGLRNNGEVDIDCGGPNCPACGMVRISGFLKYEEASGPGGETLKPIRNVRVELTRYVASTYDYKPQPTGRTIMTDSRGYFEFILPRAVGESYGFRLKAYNWAARVEKDFDGDNEYVYFEGRRVGNYYTLMQVNATGQADGGTFVARRTYTTYSSDQEHDIDGRWYEDRFAEAPEMHASIMMGTAGYFNMIDDILLTRSWADRNRNDDDTITQADIQYPDSVDTPMYDSLVCEIMMPSSFGDSDPALVDDVIIHEYGHALEDDISNIDWSGGNHTICTDKDEEFAWNEGFPQFLAGFIVNKYRNDPLNWMDARSGTFDSLEAPVCPALNSNIEGAVSATLWDLIDSPGGAYEGSVVEPFDNIATGEGGASVIFKIFDDEMDNLIDAPDICEFIWNSGGWKAAWRGRAEENGIDPILNQYGITEDAC